MKLPTIPAHARPAGRSPLGKRTARVQFSTPECVYDSAKVEAERVGLSLERYVERLLVEAVSHPHMVAKKFGARKESN